MIFSCQENNQDNFLLQPYLEIYLSVLYHINYFAILAVAYFLELFERLWLCARKLVWAETKTWNFAGDFL